MRNSLANFVKNLQISKDFAGNRVNGLGNVPRCGGEQTKRTVPLVTFIRLWRGWLGIFGKFWKIMGVGVLLAVAVLRFCVFGVLLARKRCIFGEKGVCLEKKVYFCRLITVQNRENGFSHHYTHCRQYGHYAS